MLTLPLEKLFKLGDNTPFVDYYSLRPTPIILLELILLLVINLIMLASLSLTRMDCTRIANYFVLPVLLGLAYFNWTHYYCKQRVPDWNGQPRQETEIQLISSPSTTGVDSFELAIANGLSGLVLVHLAANLFSSKLSKLLD